MATNETPDVEMQHQVMSAPVDQQRAKYASTPPSLLPCNVMRFGVHNAVIARKWWLKLAMLIFSSVFSVADYPHRQYSNKGRRGAPLPLPPCAA